MQTSARIGATATTERQAVSNLLLAILGVGAIVRLLFLGSDGFHNDIAAFESWTITLRDNAPWMFYAKSGFADYPPGYFVVLWVLAKVYAVCSALTGNADPAHGYGLLRGLVKLPAIAMDLVDAAVIFSIVRRYASSTIALLAAAVMALNPTSIYVSAYWGQIDSVSWGLVLIAIWCTLRSGDEPGKLMPRLIWAWLAFAFSILIKPQAATIGLLLLAYPFATTDAALRARRLAAAGAGLGAAAVMTIAIALLFHPAADVLGWLLARYTFGSNVYAYNSVNAFNLYAIARTFWIPDTDPLTFFGLTVGPLAYWGVALVAGASALIVGRYLQRRDERALLEGALLCALAFFVLATRMHERYLYGAFLMAMPLIAFGRSGLYTSLALSVTLYMNLVYSLVYQRVMEAHTTGVDASNLWPITSHAASLANVVIFFWLGYRYLGTSAERADVPIFPIRRAPGEAAVKAPSRSLLQRLAASGRGWFSPREGIATLSRLDALLIVGFVLTAFVIPIVNYAWPPDRIFDEIYFARAGEEYLRGINQFEWTHPPFTKEVIAFSMLLFGGLHGLGNTAYGWRFLNIVIGALEVGILYAFAKRLTASTLFAALAALMLTFDGFHFTEERLATGEITIATLIVLVLYALYRYWLNVQIRVDPIVPRAFARPFWITLAAGVPVAAAFSWLVNLTPSTHNPEIAAGIAQATAGWNAADLADKSPLLYFAGTYELAFLYAMLGVYLVARLVVPRFLAASGKRVTYADGTVVTANGAQTTIASQPPATFDPPELQAEYGRDATLRYATPDGSARFSPDGTLTVDDGAVLRAHSARTWLIVLLGALGLLASSKWNGAFDFIVTGFVVLLVSLQRFVPARALYGNPRGFRVDVVLGLAVFVAGAVYALSYTPFFLQGHGFADMIQLQKQMYWYHSGSVANATHPYMSKWWQWPIMQIPISYYYHDFRTGAATQDPNACCVAEILALPNPVVFLLGLLSVPFVGVLAWRERNKGYALLVVAYFVQWLPWVRAPRLLFEYHFFPNLAIIVLCNAVLIQRVYRRIRASERMWYLGAYAVLVIGTFAYFYPVLAGVQVSYAAWYDRMWPDRLHIPHTSWIVPPH